MRFGVLGPVAVWTSGGEPVTVPGLKVRALLAVLLLHEGRLVSADRLIEDLWGDDPPKRNPPGALSAKVSQLRRALEDAEPGTRELVMSRPTGYQLRLEDGALDAQRFQALLDRAREAGGRRAALLTEALALWRGPAFADFKDEAFAQAAIARLEEQRLTALEDAAQARLALGEHTALVGELGELLAVHPLRERLRDAHMRALYGAGRQSEALDSFEELRVHLAEELGLDPAPELVELQQAILTQSLEAPAARPRSNLPAQLTELIGRKDAVTELTRLLESERLVTLTGPGGVGKTRLAIETAAQLTGAFPDGTWLAELAGTGPGAVADTVISALDVRDSDLPGVLATRSLLLVLDNCEHVVDQVAELAGQLLRAAPDLRILATSQEPLGLAGETVWNVSPLEQEGAISLFLERASAAARGLALEPEAVALLCRRLDGIPLALELAANRVRALGLDGVVARLDDRFRLLATGHRGAPPRQQTLQAMIDWSWELLTVPEQIVLRRLAVHADGCTLEAAESVCAEDGLDVVELLVRLVDRSLVVMVQTADGSRYRLLESVAAYCLDRLDDAAEHDLMRQRHLTYYLALAEQAELHGPRQRHWLRRLDAESANLRAVLGRADADTGVRLTNALTWYWFLRGRLTEARRSLEAVLALAPDDPQSLAWLTGITFLQGETADRATRRAAVLARQDDAGWARAAWFLVFCGLGTGDLAADEDLLDQALARFQSTGDQWGEAAVRMTRATLAHVRSDLVALERDARGGAALFDTLGDRWGRLRATEWLAALAEMTGDLPLATRLHLDGLRLAEELELWPDVSTRLSWLGWIAMQQGDHPRALEYGTRAFRLATEQGARSGEIFAETVLAFAARRAGQFDLAETHLDHLLADTPRNDPDPPVHLTMLLTELGFIAEQRAQPDRALALHLESFAAAEKLDAPRDKIIALEGLAGACRDPAAAAQMLGAAAAVRQSSSLPPAPAEQADLDRITAACREHLTEETFAAAFAQGGELTPEQARNLACPA